MRRERRTSLQIEFSFFARFNGELTLILMTATGSMIRKLLETQSLSAPEILAKLKSDDPTLVLAYYAVRQQLLRMEAQGLLVRESRGCYRVSVVEDVPIPETVTPPTPEPVAPAILGGEDQLLYQLAIGDGMKLSVEQYLEGKNKHPKSFEQFRADIKAKHFDQPAANEFWSKAKLPF